MAERPVCLSELLRVYSPSAEVRGHGEGTRGAAIWQTLGQHCQVLSQSAITRSSFCLPMEHSTGIYLGPAYLYWLGLHQDQLWQALFGKIARRRI